MPLQIYNTTRRIIPEVLLEEVINDVLLQEGYTVDSIGAVYCGNQMSRRINGEFLKHDYATDTVTFRYNEGSDVEGEFYISLDVVDDNASRFGTDFIDELLRVTIHSVLHLIGYDDKIPESKAEMTEKEDLYLKRIKKT